MKTWTTRYGEVIPYKDLSNNHLSNIIKYLRNKIDIGDTWVEGYLGCLSDIDSFDVYDINIEEDLKKTLKDLEEESRSREGYEKEITK